MFARGHFDLSPFWSLQVQIGGAGVQLVYFYSSNIPQTEKYQDCVGQEPKRG